MRAATREEIMVLEQTLISMKEDLKEAKLEDLTEETLDDLKVMMIFIIESTIAQNRWIIKEMQDDKSK